ncbi:DUF3429 domain-containing protein [uncultured Sphingomonas sp.]|uniref:DUF3429 domain-containing protein n=1 Tax=uncultured Sphingomonas sp. TaxID=158754 RepID=UPI0037491538
MTDGRVGGTARLLGFAGLLPSLGSVALIAVGWPQAIAIAAFYPLLILSFLGGIWWGFAMRDTANQTALVVLAVVPSLIALTLGLGLFVAAQPGWSLVAIGVALMLTLPVDRRLASQGIAPAGWMALRIPLSLGLGTLTILAGVLISRYP